MTIYGVQFDTVSPLPFVPALQAFYINGRYAHKPVTYGRGRVWVDVNGTDPAGAFWLDVETGDAAPVQVPGWLSKRAVAGLGEGGIYCGRALLPAVLHHAGQRPFSLWLATLDGNTTPDVSLPATVTLSAVQAIPRQMLGFNADLSVVTDRAYWAERHA
jgi:hypothetical protein